MCADLVFARGVNGDRAGTLTNLSCTLFRGNRGIENACSSTQQSTVAVEESGAGQKERERGGGSVRKKTVSILPSLPSHARDEKKKKARSTSQRPDAKTEEPKGDDDNEQLQLNQPCHACWERRGQGAF